MTTHADPAVREQQALQAVIDRLTRSFAGTYTGEQVGETVKAVHHRFEDKPIRDFVPVLVERLARDRLRTSVTD